MAGRKWGSTTLFRKRTLAVAAIASLYSGLCMPTASAQSNEANEALAAQMVGTWSVSFQPIMREGNLDGCTLVYNALYQDWTYRQGGFIRVWGSVGFFTGGNNIGAMLKVGVTEIDPSLPSLGMQPSPPSRAYILGDNFESNLSSLVSSSASDTPGGLVSVFQMSPTLELVMSGLAKNRLTIAFNSYGGATDIQLPIELDVVSVSDSGHKERSAESATSFLECAQVLVGRWAAE